DAAVLGGNVENVLRAHARDGNAGKIKRLGIHFAVDGEFTKLAEGAGIDISGGENRFVNVLASAHIVVVVGDHIDGGRSHGRIDGKRGEGACAAAVGFAED